MRIICAACRILNFTPDLSYYETRRAIYRAFSVWSDVATLQFHEVQSGPADIQIEFASGYHHDGYPFDGEGRFNCGLILSIVRSHPHYVRRCAPLLDKQRALFVGRSQS